MTAFTLIIGAVDHVFSNKESGNEEVYHTCNQDLLPFAYIQVVYPSL